MLKIAPEAAADNGGYPAPRLPPELRAATFMNMSIYRTERFQGATRTRRYFEGWYFKQVSVDGRAWSFIPGISMGEDASDRRAFIQAIDGSTGETNWHEFPHESFRWEKDRLEVSVGENRFSTTGLRIALPGLEADLRFGPLTPFPSRPWRPGIMGPYAFIPFMECNHGLVSLDHRVDGFVRTAGGTVSMDGARGYIEKDWGRSMPGAWVWAQSNSFARQGDSLMFSLARVPWLGGSFPGFLCATRFGGDGDRFRIWATWNGSRVLSARATDSGMDFTLGRNGAVLELSFSRGRGGLLRAPVAGSMDRRISESVDASLSAKLVVAGRTVFEGDASPAGLETVGDLSSLGVRLPG